jgi:SAM-dependent methyltransferase
MVYYDRMARKWHSVTGARGGAVKELLLNERLLERIGAIDGRAILELGIGNGYFMPLVLRRYSGQVPARLVLSDVSRVLLALARRTFPVAEAEYVVLDARDPFPLAARSLNLVLSSMVLNELPAAGLARALAECRRVLSPGGRLLAAVLHPEFVQSLARRGQLKPLRGGSFTMPGAEGLRLPVVTRRVEQYLEELGQAGFSCQTEELRPTAQLLNAKPALRQAGDMPIVLILDAEVPGNA